MGLEMVSSQHSENSSSSSRAVMLSTRMDSKTSGSSFEAGASEKPLPYARVVENSGDDLVKDCELKSPQPTAPPRASSMDAKIDSLEGRISYLETNCMTLEKNIYASSPHSDTERRKAYASQKKLMQYIEQGNLLPDDSTLARGECALLKNA